MITLLYGQDTYRSHQKLKEIIERFKKDYPQGLDLVFWDAKKIDFQEFKEGIKNVSIFTKKRLIILNNIFLNPILKREILEFLKRKKT